MNEHNNIENKHGSTISKTQLNKRKRKPMKTTNCTRRRQPGGDESVNDDHNTDTMNDGNQQWFGEAITALHNHGEPAQPIHFPAPVAETAEQLVETLTLRPHNQYVILCLKASGLLLAFLYFGLPILIRFNPWIMRELTFLNRISWPPFIDLNNPNNYGLEGARSFRLEMTSGISLGVWHVLPSELATTATGDNSDTFMRLLSGSRKVILYLHGNAGSRAGWHRVQLYKVLTALGYHVITFDYRGYGDSSGAPTEDGVCEDSISMYKWLKQQGVTDIYIWGHSLGSGIAVKVTKILCEMGIPPKGLVLESAFNNVIDAVYYYPFARPFVMMPWFSWAIVESIKQNNISFASDTTISSIPIPILMLHAKDDRTVPYVLGQKLYETAQLTKRKTSIKFVVFEDNHGYGHKHIHKAPELPHIIRDFMATTD